MQSTARSQLCCTSTLRKLIYCFACFLNFAYTINVRLCNIFFNQPPIEFRVPSNVTWSRKIFRNILPCTMCVYRVSVVLTNYLVVTNWYCLSHNSRAIRPKKGSKTHSVFLQHYHTQIIDCLRVNWSGISVYTRVRWVGQNLDELYIFEVLNFDCAPPWISHSNQSFFVVDFSKLNFKESFTVARKRLLSFHIDILFQ